MTNSLLISCRPLVLTRPLFSTGFCLHPHIGSTTRSLFATHGDTRPVLKTKKMRSSSRGRRWYDARLQGIYRRGWSASLHLSVSKGKNDDFLWRLMKEVTERGRWPQTFLRNATKIYPSLTISRRAPACTKFLVFIAPSSHTHDCYISSLTPSTSTSSTMAEVNKILLLYYLA
jgi:hypothetical protein